MTLLTRTLSLLLATPLLPLVLPVAPAQAEVQPCTVSYSNTGAPIAPTPTGPDPNSDHSWLGVDVNITDSRVVTDIDITADLTHPDASALSLHLLSPQTQYPSLQPTVQAMNPGLASGAFNGVYTFDEEVGAATISGANPAPGTYLPITPEAALEGHPAAGRWSLWINNYNASPGTIRSFTLTLTYATCDIDGDGTEDSVDNCLTVPNDQANHDLDALGDACDLDMDGDNLPNLGDGCPIVASANPTGCPSASRRAGLRYLKGKNKLQVRISSPVASCAANARIVLWRARKKRDVRLVVVNANSQGRHRFKVPRGARYYVTVSPSYSSGVAECTNATSRAVRVPRRRR